MDTKLLATDPLEQLLCEALIAQTPKVTRRTAEQKLSRGDFKAAEKALHELFADPLNWNRIGGVALIHQDTDTLLGNFSEYKHNSTSAKKFVRETQLLAVQRTEYVSGPWWIEQISKKADPARWIETRDAVVDVVLPSLSLAAFTVPLTVRLEFGGIARAELKEATRFVSANADIVLWIPGGINVLEAMSDDCKICLKSELGL